MIGETLISMVAGGAGAFVYSRWFQPKRLQGPPVPPQPGPPEPPVPPPGRVYSDSTAKVRLEAGMLVLIPSTGGYAPDATDAELVRVTDRVEDGWLQVESLRADGYTRAVQPEVYAEAARVVNVQKLEEFLDALGMGESEARRKSATPLLRSPGEWLFQ